MIDVLRQIEQKGLLLLQDKRWPSVVTIVVGEPIASSWWAHRDARRIWSDLRALSDHADVLATKLIAGKVTFVHRSLWPALFGVGAAREPWQTAGLSPQARRLLRTLDARGSVRATGKEPKLLERRLVARAGEVHTESGAHALLLETWRSVAKRLKCESWLDPAEGRRVLAAAAAAIGVPASRLPWTSPLGAVEQGTPDDPA